MNPAKLWALVRHELRLFFSDRRAVVSTVLVPIGIASFFGYIFGGAGGDGPSGQLAVLVADDDRSETSKELVAGLKGNPLLRVTEVGSVQLGDAVRTGKSSVGIVLTKGFGEKAGRAFFGGAGAPRPEVMLYHDPSRGSDRQMARGMLTEQVMKVVGKRALSPSSTAALDAQLKAVQASPALPGDDRAALTDLLTSARRFVGRSPSGGGALSMPAEIREEAVGSSRTQERVVTVAHAFAGMAVQGLLFYAIDAAMGLLRDRRLGIWKRLRAAPITRSELIAGRLIATSIISCAVIVAVFAAGMLFFKLRITGSVAGFALLCVCGAVMASTFGLLIAALGRTEAQSRGFAIPAVLAMNLLGGSWFPSFLMPKAVQTLSVAIPTRWAVDGFDAMLWRGLGIQAALAPAGALLGFAAVFLTFALFRFRWEVE